MTKRIFRFIVSSLLAVLLAAAVLIIGVIYSYFTQVQHDQLRVETALAAHAVTNEGLDYFDKLDGTMDCRITWIDQDGTVLYDNRSDTGSMENHLAREEVVEEAPEEPEAVEEVPEEPLGYQVYYEEPSSPEEMAESGLPELRDLELEDDDTL